MKSFMSAKGGKKIMILVPMVVLLAAGCGKQTVSTTNNNSDQQTAQDMQMPPISTSTPSSTPSTNSPAPSNDPGMTKTFTVTGQNFSFTPNQIKVNKGDKVKIIFENSGGFHDFVLDAFNVKTSNIQSGASATVEFTADKTGTFEYYCSVSNHRAMGMKGNLIVQ